MCQLYSIFEAAPHAVLACAAGAFALTLFLYILLDAFKYRRIPKLDVPLTAGIQCAVSKHSTQLL